ncbi:hypothetical protein LTR37_010999 [Vermiconidia calcicola]|uniref:Uncharacterized protein n=1 Tax=Vermiconidia calcicola TaxID=1690605 RepID=A0ACC3N3U2_9PEZI|nr:hypothetical protein LTR37_010999 [Vermiconidia calcicola]
MGKAYSEDQRLQVKALLEQGRDEEAIEKETGVSDRTVRRWKLELERTGRIGKPPESRTGRHRVLTPEVESALFKYVKGKPDMSVDDMLWWLYDNYKLVVGTRTIRRVFERKGDKVKPGKTKGVTRRKSDANEMMDSNPDDEEEDDGLDEEMPEAEEQQVTSVQTGQYQSPYAPVPSQSAGIDVESQLRQAMEQQHTPQHPYPALMDLEDELPEDEETIQLQLQQIALQKREIELKLKMRRLTGGQSTPGSSVKKSSPSTLYDPTAVVPTPAKRDSRSKKKIEESKRRTAERQERMLRDLERRSRRRDHLTAEWVQSKDIWPLRAQSMLAELMHQYGYYAYSQNNEQTFDTMYRDLYQLVDLSKGDWDPNVHDEMLRERTKRKMGQLRTKMQKTGEIVGRNDGYGGFQRAENYTGEQAGNAVGDDNDMVQDPALHQDPMQAQPGAPNMQHDEPLAYDPVPPDQQMQHANMQYPNPINMQYPNPGHQGPGQYPMVSDGQYLPYLQTGTQHGMSHQDGFGDVGLHQTV